MELVLWLIIAIFVLAYRYNTGDNVYKFFADTVSNVYNTYAPYSFKEVRQKTKELGFEYTARQYATQIAMFGGAAGFISFMYFYSIPITILYAVIAILFVPYIAYLNTMRKYSEYIF
jgi:hypothetical protein